MNRKHVIHGLIHVGRMKCCFFVFPLSMQPRYVNYKALLVLSESFDMSGMR